MADLAEQARNAVAAALAEPPLDEDLWGAVPDDADIVREAVNAAVSDWRATEQLSRRSVAATEAAELLGLSVEELARWAARREVIAFDHAGDQWFPAWQFEADIERSQLAHLWRRFPGDAIWFSEWVHAPNPALGGAPPVERLQDGDLEAVVAAAEAITA